MSNKLKSFQEIFNKSDYYSTNIISDGIILEIENIANIGYGRFVEILNDIGKKQFSFIKEHKLFIRGGIATGTKLDDDKHFISNGLARAVKMESKNIDWPIIGTDQKCFNDLKKNFYSYDPSMDFNLKRSYNKKGEDIYFINFIEKDKEYYKILTDKVVIEYGGKYQSKIKSKYIWLLKYYHYEYGNEDIANELKGIIL